MRELLIIALWVLLWLGFVAATFGDVRRDTVIAVIVGEAGGEGTAGMVAVANVLRNRADIRGSSMYAEAVRKSQFDAVKRPDFIGWAKRHKSWATASAVYDGVLAGKMRDNTGGATHFINPKACRVLPRWYYVYPTTATIGRHTFKKGAL